MPPKQINAQGVADEFFSAIASRKQEEAERLFKLLKKAPDTDAVLFLAKQAVNLEDKKSAILAMRFLFGKSGYKTIAEAKPFTETALSEGFLKSLQAAALLGVYRKTFEEFTASSEKRETKDIASYACGLINAYTLRSVFSKKQNLNSTTASGATFGLRKIKAPPLAEIPSFHPSADFVQQISPQFQPTQFFYTVTFSSMNTGVAFLNLLSDGLSGKDSGQMAAFLGGLGSSDVMWGQLLSNGHTQSDFISAIQSGDFKKASEMLSEHAGSEFLALANAKEIRNAFLKEVNTQYYLTGKDFLNVELKFGDSSCRQWERNDDGTFASKTVSQPLLSSLGVGVGTHFLIWDAPGVIAGTVVARHDYLRENKADIRLKLDSALNLPLGLGNVQLSGSHGLSGKGEYQSRYSLPEDKLGVPAIALAGSFSLQESFGKTTRLAEVGLISKKVPHFEKIRMFAGFDPNNKNKSLSLELNSKYGVSLNADYIKTPSNMEYGIELPSSNLFRVGVTFNVK